VSGTASPFAGLSQAPHGLWAEAAAQSKPELACFLAQLQPGCTFCCLLAQHPFSPAVKQPGCNTPTQQTPGLHTGVCPELLYMAVTASRVNKKIPHSAPGPAPLSSSLPCQTPFTELSALPHPTLPCAVAGGSPSALPAHAPPRQPHTSLLSPRSCCCVASWSLLSPAAPYGVLAGRGTFPRAPHTPPCPLAFLQRRAPGFDTRRSPGFLCVGMWLSCGVPAAAASPRGTGPLSPARGSAGSASYPQVKNSPTLT